MLHAFVRLELCITVVNRVYLILSYCPVVYCGAVLNVVTETPEVQKSRRHFHSCVVIYGTVSRRRSGQGATCSSSAGAPETGRGMRPAPRSTTRCTNTPAVLLSPQAVWCGSQHFPGNTDTPAYSIPLTCLFFSESGRWRRVGSVSLLAPPRIRPLTASLGF